MGYSRFSDRIGRKITDGIIARLEEYELTFNKISSKNPSQGYGNIQKSKGSVVYGIVYCVTENELNLLDGFEGVQQGMYKRINVDVTSESNETLSVICYEACPKWVGTNLKPTKEYLQHFFNTSLPLEYIKKLQQVACAEDEMLPSKDEL
jgi:gamma-glutamylcyclotransferase (GGCT)/AIG2-like uncharacterized protein YtfP